MPPAADKPPTAEGTLLFHNKKCKTVSKSVEAVFLCHFGVNIFRNVGNAITKQDVRVALCWNMAAVFIVESIIGDLSIVAGPEKCHCELDSRSFETKTGIKTTAQSPMEDDFMNYVFCCDFGEKALAFCGHLW